MCQSEVPASITSPSFLHTSSHSALCPEEKRQSVVEKIHETLTRHVYERVTAYVRSALTPLQEELRRSVVEEAEDGQGGSRRATGLHVSALDATACAVTMLEMLDGVLKSKFAKSLPPHREQELAARNKKKVEGVETLLGTTVGCAVSYIATHALTILAKHQRKDDYKPNRKEGMGAVVHTITPACERYAQYLKRQITCVVDGLAGSPGTLQSASELLCTLLLVGLKAHLKSFVVTEEGALRLKRDVAEYCSAMLPLPNNPKSAAFEQIRDIANLFIVSPACLKDLTSVSPLSDLSTDELNSFLKMRPDWKDLKSKLPT